MVNDGDRSNHGKPDQPVELVQPYCAICMLKTAYKVLCLATGADTRKVAGDEQMREIHMAGVASMLECLEDFSEESLPVIIASRIFQQIKTITGNPDPYKDIKEKGNRISLQVEPEVRAILARAATPKQRLLHTILASIAGNNIDFVTGGHTFEVTQQNLLREVEKTIARGLQVDDYDRLWSALQEHPECLYIHDNAGEIVFDKLVVEVLEELGIRVTSVVKGGPVANDATMDDAEMVGLTEVATRVITTGSDYLGFHLDHLSGEFQEALRSDPVLITKGQSNFEAFNVFRDHPLLAGVSRKFLILKLKCDGCAHIARAHMGDNLVKQV